MMKTQGLSMSMTKIQVSAKGQSQKSESASFEGYISREKTTIKAESSTRDVQKTNKSEEASDVKEYSKPFVKMKDTSAKDVEVSEETIEEMNSNIVSIMSQATGLDAEDIVDIMEQMGAMPVDFTLVVTEVEVTINVENIKAFVMETHGIDDANLFLTSDRLMDEVNEILSGIENMLSDYLDVDFGSLLGDDIEFLKSFQEMFHQYAEGQIEMTGKEKDIPSEQANYLENTVFSEDTQSSTIIQSDFSKESDSSDLTGEKEEVVEFDISPSQSEDTVDANVGQTNAFVERLNESIRGVTSEETSYSEVTMDQVVEQVVKHVRIRVMPQTTSMELQLNPETLGRVNLNVVSNNGVATATLTVQNEFAKEALESQLIVLKENLESQGLKVESVEVNVSEFGFKNQEDANQEQYKPKNSRRRFRAEAMDDLEEESVENEQLSDNVVDYTA